MERASFNGEESDQIVDVAIIGGGLVGRPLAAALADQGLAVVLVDRMTAADHSTLSTDPLDQRCTALSAGSVDWLRQRGLWNPDTAGASPIRQVQVSQRGHFGGTRIDAADLDRESLGWTIENRCFAASLTPLLAGRKLRLLDGYTVRSLEQQDAAVTLSLSPTDQIDRAEHVQARLVVVADGARSATAELLGVSSTETQHRQWATLTTVSTDRAHDDVARERFCDSGPLALLPRPGPTLSVVACHDEQDRASIEALDDAAFLAWLGERMPSRSGRALKIGPRVCLPLTRIEADTQRVGRCVLIGNAARLLHPVAGQGYNLALRDVATLVEAVSGVQDPGAEPVLESWLADRDKDQRRTVGLTDGLARLFRGHSRVLGHARAGGLLALDLVPAARRAFARSTTRGPLL